jgi:hypothetical protein
MISWTETFRLRLLKATYHDEGLVLLDFWGEKLHGREVHDQSAHGYIASKNRLH